VSPQADVRLAGVNLDLAALPTDVDALHRLVRDLVAQAADEQAKLERSLAEVERLRSIVHHLQRAQFGRRSERLDADQLALGLEDLDVDIARVQAPLASPADEDAPDPPSRPRSLPKSLAREDITCDVADTTCPCCGGALHAIGESVSEMLDFVPARLRVLRIRRPKYGCRACGTIHQAPAPERPITKGLASPALLAHVLVSKYCDHTPLYRQSQIFARHGVELDRSTLANWVGGACWWLEPLQARLAAHVFGSTKVFADDVPIPVLAVVAPRPAGCGSIRAKIGHGPVPTHQPPSTSTARTARRNVLLLTSKASGAFSRSMATRASNGSPLAATSCLPPVGRTPGANFMRCTKRPDRRSPPGRCAGSQNSTQLKPRSAAAPPSNDSRPVTSERGP
jgi:transposase